MPIFIVDHCFLSLSDGFVDPAVEPNVFAFRVEFHNDCVSILSLQPIAFLDCAFFRLPYVGGQYFVSLAGVC